MFTELKKVFTAIVWILLGYLVFQYLTSVVTLIDALWPTHWAFIGKTTVVIVLFVLPFVIIGIKLIPLLKYRAFDFDKKTGKLDTPQYSAFYHELFNHILDKIDNNSEKKKILESGLRNFNYKDAWEEYKKACKNECDTISREYALLSASAIVISPVGAGDMLLSLFWNLRLIHKIIDIYKIRPSLGKLCQIYSHVLFSSLLSSSIEDVLDSGTIDSITGGLLRFLPVKELLVQVSHAVFAIIRTGYLTQCYLTSEQDIMKDVSIKKDAKNYAAKQLPIVIKEAVMKCLPSNKPLGE